MNIMVISARSTQNESFELVADSMAAWLDAKNKARAIEVKIAKAPEEYQSLIDTKILADFTGETITLNIPGHEKSGKIHLRQTGFFFPRHP